MAPKLRLHGGGTCVIIFTLGYPEKVTTAWDDAEVGAGTSVWTVEGDKEKALGEDGEDLSDNEDGDDSTKESRARAPVS